MNDYSLKADFIKIDKKQHIVEGYATTVNVDRDGQRMDADFLRRAFVPWAEKFGNIRYLHQPQVVGKVIDYSDFDGVGYRIVAKISDPKSWSQIESGEINGFSIGIKRPVLAPDDDAPRGKFVDGEIIETSIVDIPSSYDTNFTAVKTATFDVAKGVWSDDMNDMNMDAFCDDINDDDMDAYKRYYSAKERREMPESDFAGPNKTYPIETQEDVDNATHLVGRAKDPDAVRRRIIEIAERKGFDIPDAWKGDAHKDITLDSGLQGHNLEGQEDETVSDENKTTEIVAEDTIVVSEELTQEVEKTVSADESVDTTATEQVETEAEKAATIDPTVTEQIFNTLNAITAKLDALASQTDKDKDGDIDTDGELEAEAKGNAEDEKASDFDPDDVSKKFVESEEFVNAIKSVVAQVLSEQSDAQKTLVADEAKSLVADVEKRFGELSDTVSKFATRLETVEQMAAPPKGSVMAIEREVQKTATADAFEVVQKFASQLPEDAQKDLFKHMYSQNLNLNGGN